MFDLGLVVLIVFLYFFLLSVALVLTVFFLLFCFFMVANPMGFFLSGNREINIMMMTMIIVNVVVGNNYCNTFLVSIFISFAVFDASRRRHKF